ncbi:MAG: class II histone deacetylase, partial [Pseudomonadota bacterium]
HKRCAIDHLEPEGDLLRVHSRDYLRTFKEMSDKGGGEIGLRAPFGDGGYELAALSAGLAKEAVLQVLDGQLRNAYALTRPPGHHCLPDWPNGFCLLANIAIAVEAALAGGQARRVAVLDWDVHHGNGTEAIFYERADVLTVSIHQAHNYPLDTGDFADRGKGMGEGFNLNIPLPPGAGEAAWKAALSQLALPQIAAFKPDLIVVASGYDASAVDPLGRMVLGADCFGAMTRATMATADEVCDGRLVLVHEGGYSEVHAPFCGHSAISALAGRDGVTDPLGQAIRQRQPDAATTAFHLSQIEAMVAAM